MPAADSCRAIASVSVPLREISASRPGLQKLGAIEPSRPRPGTFMPSVFGPRSQHPHAAHARHHRQRIVHRNVLGHGHDGADAPGGAFVHGVAKPFWRRVDERHIGVLHVGDAIEERKSLHGLAAAAERDAAHDLRAGGDQARDLTAGVTPGRVDHRDAPRLGVEKWQARERRHARLRG